MRFLTLAVAAALFTAAAAANIPQAASIAPEGYAELLEAHVTTVDIPAGGFETRFDYAGLCARDDQQTLRQQAQSGRLTAESLVWRQGMASWIAASQVPEVAALLGGSPPPMPEVPPAPPPVS